MSLYFLIALMTCAAIFAVLWPLGRGKSRRRAATSLDIYRDQLAEIDADLASGQIPASEADATRAEISRRLLRAGESETPATKPSLALVARRVTAALALVALPAIAIALYAWLGSPSLPDRPIASRQNAPASAEQSLQNLVAQVEAHLEKNPREGEGWRVLAPALMRLGRYDDAARAFRNVIAIVGDSASLRADLGEAIAAAANGVITADAKREFEAALALDAGDAKARYFLGLAAQQDGRRDEAVAIWQKLAADAPANAPWLPLVRRALSDSGAAATAQGDAPKGPSAQDIEAAGRLSPEERAQMIRSMVEGLDARLNENPADADGWMRLVRAHAVLGDKVRAADALKRARAALVDRSEALTKLNAIAAELGL